MPASLARTHTQQGLRKPREGKGERKSPSDAIAISCANRRASFLSFLFYPRGLNRYSSLYRREGNEEGEKKKKTVSMDAFRRFRISLSFFLQASVLRLPYTFCGKEEEKLRALLTAAPNVVLVLEISLSFLVARIIGKRSLAEESD